MKKTQQNKKLVFGLTSTISIFLFIFFLISTSQPVTVTSSQNVLNGINTVTINKTCTDIIPYSNLCQLSKTPSSAYSNSTVLPANVVLLPPNANTTPGISTPPSNPPSQPVTLQVLASLTDDNGKITTEKSNNSFNLFDLVYNSNSNAPFNTGKADIQLSLTAKPLQKISFNGNLFVTVNGTQKYPSGIPVYTTGTTDSNGNINLNLSTPLGILQKLSIIPSQDFTNYGTYTYQFNIQNMTIQTGDGKSYINNKLQKIYTISFTKNANQISLQNANGTYALGYPSDDQFSFCGQDTYTDYSKQIYGSYNTRGGNGYTYQIVYTWYLTPSLGTATISSGSAQLGTIDHTSLHPFYRYALSTQSSPVLYESGSYCSSISNIPRNTPITIQISGNYPLTQSFTTPVSQESYEYLCTTTSSGTSCVWSQSP